VIPDAIIRQSLFRFDGRAKLVLDFLNGTQGVNENNNYYLQRAAMVSTEDGSRHHRTDSLVNEKPLKKH